MIRTILLLLVLSPWPAHGSETFNLAVHDQDIQVTRFSPDEGQGQAVSSQQLMIWVMPRLSASPRLFTLAQQVAKQGIEVWLVDLAESLFLPDGPATQRSIHGRYVSGLVQAAHQRSGKTISLMARDYAAIPVLKGARDWQQLAPQKNYLAGVVLLSPDLYATIPALGLDPVYEPIASATNVPIMLYQSAKRGNRWQLDKVLEKLRSGGAQVYFKILPGVVGLIDEEDTTAVTQQALVDFPLLLVQGLQLLQRETTPLTVARLEDRESSAGLGLDIQLMPYRGKLSPRPLALINAADGRRVVRDDYRGRVTVMNFWATWCPPCVEEIPSINHLRQLMADTPFELISINYAEEPQRIKQFLREVNVEFPVLLDQDGSYSAQWNVLVFPSTFVIGPDGQIVYGVNGAIYWDSAPVVEQLRALLP